MDKKDRNDYFVYKEEDGLHFENCQCDFCIYNIPGVRTKCKKYIDMKPGNVRTNDVLCDFISFSEDND